MSLPSVMQINGDDGDQGSSDYAPVIDLPLENSVGFIPIGSFIIYFFSFSQCFTSFHSADALPSTICVGVASQLRRLFAFLNYSSLLSLFIST